MSGNSPAAGALEGLGQAVQGVSQDVFEVLEENKRKADATNVMGIQVSLNRQTGGLQNAALARKGHDALDNKSQYDAFDKIYSEHQSQLKNDTQRFMFNQQTANDRNQFALALERHAGEQGQILSVDNATALVDTDKQKLSTLYRDPAAFEQQLKQTQAHTLDKLHMQGIIPSDPVAVKALFDVKSDAHLIRIKPLILENPAEAKHYFEVHQDEIEPKERDTIQKSIELANAKGKGNDLAFELLQKLKDGADVTTVIEEGRKRLGGDNEAFEHFQTEVKQLHGDIKAAKVEKIDTLSNSMYGQAIDFEAKNKHPMSPDEFMKTQEFQAAHNDPEAQKAARAALDKVTTAYRSWQGDERKIATEIRRNNLEGARLLKEERKEGQDKELAELYLNPDAVASMTDGQLKDRYHNLGHTNFIKAVEFKKSMASPEKLAEAKLDVNDFHYTLNKIGIDPKTKSVATQAKITAIHTRFNDLVAEAQKTEGRQLRRDEKKKLMLQAATIVPVKTKQSFLGIPMGETTEDKMMSDVEFKGNIKVAGKDRQDIVADFKSHFRRAPTENEIIDAYIAKTRPE
jgi:hypothetical protein